jgi:glycerol-3-phosphate dehydrogenase
VEYTARARAVVNATGPFTDAFRQLDDPASERMISPSQGVHLVFDRSLLPGTDAIMVPHTGDGRIIFVIPWNDRVIVGTTDTPIDTVTDEPLPREDEIDFLLETSARYLIRDPQRADVRGAFVGIRPLVRDDGGGATAAISREHTVSISKSGLVTIAGGKWTTYRKMAEDTVDCAAAVAELPQRPCVTETLRIHGYDEHADRFGRLAVYGAAAAGLERMMADEPRTAEVLHPSLEASVAQVVWAVRHEMARTVEDVLSRRTRALILDTSASIEVAPRVARLMAAELGRDAAWVQAQASAFQSLAERLRVT